MAKRRTPILTGTAAAVLFAADRTCCVCRLAQKPIQIHHIDEDPTNHDPSNLAVLCLDCHEATQARGGFSRGLDGDQIRLYRESWNQTVAARRSTAVEQAAAAPSGPYDADLATSLVEIDREAGNWVNLVFLYDALGNEELRDAAVERAIEGGVTNQVLGMLRRLQGRLSEVPTEIIDAHIAELRDANEYRLLAVMYEDLGRYRDAAEVYLRGLVSELGELSNFTLAHHLAEFASTEVIPGLFVRALQEAADNDDLWWQMRALEELEWTSELYALVLDNEERIATDPDLDDTQRGHLRLVLARAKGDDRAYKEARKDLERLEAEIDWNT